MTADDVLPVGQAEKQRIVERLRKKLTPRIRAQLSPEEQDKLDGFLGNGPMPSITAANLPEGLLTGLRERDGTLGRTILVFPRPTQTAWYGPDMSSFVEQLRVLAASASGVPARVAGALPVTADILSCMSRDGPLASLLAFVGVVLVVVVLFRASLATLKYCILGFLLLGLIFTDAETQLLPDKMTLPGLALGLLFSMVVPVNDLASQLLPGLVSHGMLRTPRTAVMGESCGILQYRSPAGRSG